MTTLENALLKLQQKLKDAELLYLVDRISICDNQLYLRVDTADNTVKENESEAYDICEDLKTLGYEVVERQIEHDCITGTVIETPIVPPRPIPETVDYDPINLSPSQIYAWCQSLEKGSQRCRECGDRGDSSTLIDIAAYFRRLTHGTKN